MGLSHPIVYFQSESRKQKQFKLCLMNKFLLWAVLFSKEKLVPGLAVHTCCSNNPGRGRRIVSSKTPQAIQ